MRLPGALSSIIGRKKKSRELFLSLVVDPTYVSAAVWSMKTPGEASIEAAASILVPQDSWEARTQGADRVLAKLEELSKSTDIREVILGFSGEYLTESGDVKKTIQPHIKKLTKDLSLSPIGFVSLAAALVHKMKREEGIPPSAIFLGVTSTGIWVHVYKVGSLLTQSNITDTNVAHALETILKNIAEDEVLPSRMLIYGIDDDRMERLRRTLLSYPWQTKVNFLHFPKVEFLPKDAMAIAVSLAGSSELTATLSEDDEGQEEGAEQEDIPDAREDEVGEEDAPADEDEEESESAQEGEEETEEETEAEEESGESEETNVAVVDPEELGFTRHASAHVVAQPGAASSQRVHPEHPTQREHSRHDTSHHGQRDADDEDDVSVLDHRKVEKGLPVFSGVTTAVKGVLSRSHTQSKKEIDQPGRKSSRSTKVIIIFVAIVLAVVAGAGLFSWFVPRASVTIQVIPKVIDKTETIIVDSDATALIASEKTIPGHVQEKAVSGEKTVGTTGKKKVGTPAKGGVTIYNKTTSAKSYKKGTILTAKSLQFTLDEDVQVASASENLVSGTVTFGKATTKVSAVQIGTESNLSAGTEFTFKDVSSSVAVARSDEALSGGTSKDVTVVSRADQDSLVKSLTQELVEKAKEELEGSIAGGEKLVDATIKTAVSEKQFAEDIDAEAKELHGKLTITVSGVSYSETDVSAVFSEMINAEVPAGYTRVDEQTTIEIAEANLQKDGTISIAVKVKAVALPTIDPTEVRSTIAGKDVGGAKESVQSIQGVGGVDVNVRFSLWGTRLPANKQNISITVAPTEQ